MSSSLEPALSTLKAAPGAWHRPLRWCAAGLLVLLSVLLIAGTILARHLPSLVRAKLLHTFQDRFHSPVDLDALQVHYNGQIQVDGRGLRVQSVLAGVAGDPQQPMLQVQEFHFHLGVLAALSRAPRIHHVRIRGLQLNLPSGAAQQRHTPDPDPGIDLEYAEVDDAHIRFASSAPDRAPLQFDLPHLAFRGVSRSKPIQFHAVVDNGPPLGISETDGTIGPWNFDDPRRTPLQGDFSFHDKDVSSVPGLRGKFSLRGHYTGVVESMHAEGKTDDPGFALDVSSQPVDLRTNFAITLQPAQNRVSLDRVEGSFGKTTFLCHGVAVKDGVTQSFRLDVQMTATAARVEDALALLSPTSPPVMRGGLVFAAHMEMSPGPRRVARKLSLQNATFQVSDAVLTNAEVQRDVEGLLERAQGHPRDATAARAEHVVATIRGTVGLRDELLRFPSVQVSAPGAHAAMHGTYSLAGTNYTFDGTVHTEAELSQMTTGIKSLVLKPLNRLFRHENAKGETAQGSTLPLHIQGVGNKPPHIDTRLAGMRIKAPEVQ